MRKPLPYRKPRPDDCCVCCKHTMVDIDPETGEYDEPCRSCDLAKRDKWEPITEEE